MDNGETASSCEVSVDLAPLADASLETPMMPVYPSSEESPRNTEDSNDIRRPRSGARLLKRPILQKKSDENVENQTHTESSQTEEKQRDKGDSKILEEVFESETPEKKDTSLEDPGKQDEKPMVVKKKNKRDWLTTMSVFKFNAELTESEYEDRMLKYFNYDSKDPYFQTVPLEANLKTQRDRIANEIMTSEESYNIFMRILVKNWRDPLIAASKDQAISINETVIQKIFGMIDTILGISDFMLKDFRDRLSNWSSEQLMGDIFLKYGDMLKSYTVYSKERQSSKKTYDECLTRSSFQQFIKVCQKQPLNNNRFLLDYMIMPVQRVPRYELLLVDLLRHTEDSHPDRPCLEKALEKIKTIADHIDKSVEEYKHYEAVMQIQKKLSGKIKLLQPGRKLIKEGILVKTCRKTKKSRMFWLFSDLLIYAIPQVAGIYTLRYQIPMYSTIMEDVPDDEEKGNKFSFLIISKIKSFKVTASSQVEKVEWLIALNQCSQESLKKHSSFVRSNDEMDIEGQAPVWAPDESAQFCEVCSCEFNFIVRRHHCRQCGNLVCSNCSSKRVYLPHLKKENARVCDVCYGTFDFPNKNERRTILIRKYNEQSGDSIENTPESNPSSFRISDSESPRKSCEDEITFDTIVSSSEHLGSITLSDNPFDTPEDLEMNQSQVGDVPSEEK